MMSSEEYLSRPTAKMELADAVTLCREARDEGAEAPLDAVETVQFFAADHDYDASWLINQDQLATIE